jgi:Putative adipose-regulatory protein (Seipin)
MESDIYHLMQGPLPKPTNQEPTYTGHFLSLNSPSGWLIGLVAFIFELISSSFLGIIAPFICLLEESQVIPSVLVRRFVSFLRRMLSGFVGALSAVSILVMVMLISVLIGILIVRFWVDEPVEMQEVIYFDYTMKEPSAVVSLGQPRRRGVLAGHSVVVVLDLILLELIIINYNMPFGSSGA